MKEKIYFEIKKLFTFNKMELTENGITKMAFFILE